MRRRTVPVVAPERPRVLSRRQKRLWLLRYAPPESSRSLRASPGAFLFALALTSTPRVNPLATEPCLPARDRLAEVDLTRSHRLVQRWHGAAGVGRRTPGVGPS